MQLDKEGVILSRIAAGVSGTTVELVQSMTTTPASVDRSAVAE